VHGLIFFYIRKFAETLARGSGVSSTSRSGVTTATTRHLPSGVYPDGEAVELIQSLADQVGRPLAEVLERFGRFLAPHLVKIAGQNVEPDWRTLDLIEHTESIIHAMIRTTNPGTAPPVLEAMRPAADELQLVYGSRRQLCDLARGLMQGIADHYHERIEIAEHSCMHRGDPFCSFVVRLVAHDTQAAAATLAKTTVSRPGDAPVMDARADDPLPASIGGYPVLGLLGQGGMGRVYRARDERLHRDVAIKVMHTSKARDPDAQRRFLREGRGLAAVEHPHVMTVHQVGEHQGLPYIVMQRLVGRTLKQAMQTAGRLPLDEILRIARETADGLAAAHRQGLVHRDIKPDNIFLQDPDGGVRIIDFGLARPDAAEAGDVTIDGAVVGTPAYMSPEGVEGGLLDARSDLFSLGVILYELLADRLPFEGTSLLTKLAAISRGQPTDIHSLVPDLPGPLASLVMRLIAHDRTARPADAATVAHELAAIERDLNAV
jgi:tRNA A-37 threonylcarbamoyl transferase component Bud32